MQFKNVLFLEVKNLTVYTPKTLSTALEKTAFTPCRAASPSSLGWVSPSEEEYSPLVHAVDKYMMICLQIEDKILPPTVVHQELQDQVRKIEITQRRKVLAKEKYTIRNGIYNALLPKAFTKKSKIYAYFDIKNNWLITDTVSTPKVELFLKILKKTLPKVVVVAPKIKKISTIMTHWLLNNNHPKSLEIEKSCVLQDPQYQSRILRCQQQDLSAHTVKALLKDGYEVRQLALSWQNQILFTLVDNFSLKSLKYQDTVFELRQEDISNDKQEKFDLDFVTMTNILEKLLIDLTKQLFKKI
jgi:recombination associated protein RdgC